MKKKLAVLALTAGAFLGPAFAVQAPVAEARSLICWDDDSGEEGADQICALTELDLP